MVMLMSCVVRRRPERAFRPESKVMLPMESTLLSSLDRERVGMGVKERFSKDSLLWGSCCGVLDDSTAPDSDKERRVFLLGRGTEAGRGNRGQGHAEASTPRWAAPVWGILAAAACAVVGKP